MPGERGEAFQLGKPDETSSMRVKAVYETSFGEILTKEQTESILVEAAPAEEEAVVVTMGNETATNDSRISGE